jgi:hypothetical protein
MVATKTNAQTGEADPIISRLANEDKVPWYSKPNLRMLYFILFPTCMGIEITSGFDSQMINALQIVPAWDACKSPYFRKSEFLELAADTPLFFLKISGNHRVH